MSKVMIKYKHDDEAFSCMGICQNNQLSFINKNDHITVSFFTEQVVIRKENNDGVINMTFKQGEVVSACYDVKDMGKVFLSIKTNILVIRDRKLFINYQIVESNDNHIYELEYEVI